ncbi:hypothetical protein PHLGIDRAFT_432843 [Phlebiopsis gigantea 11061_1 CR5-6]|uniref:Uncharacterized protein n=1 Tax=Phlebiopsis gigantea (strain 11061_1 CR5-6) TaxID=745531 RepID=A0A0C3PL10_PHLG1|nr:hypothetical protein PHLGIDRAFT_432843 [Phlebiopsis gigantea 11061_1 CR5-6]
MRLLRLPVLCTSNLRDFPSTTELALLISNTVTHKVDIHRSFCWQTIVRSSGIWLPSLPVGYLKLSYSITSNFHTARRHARDVLPCAGSSSSGTRDSRLPSRLGSKTLNTILNTSPSSQTVGLRTRPSIMSPESQSTLSVYHTCYIKARSGVEASACAGTTSCSLQAT